MKRRIIFAILLLLWMGMIFVRSSKTADESTAESEYVGMMLGHIFVSGFDDMEPQMQRSFARSIDYGVRKTAHAGEYAVLAILVMGTFYPYGGRRRMLLYLCFCALYAASDELHQLFVPERSGQILDVFIDSAGALAGLAAGFLVLRWRRRG